MDKRIIYPIIFLVICMVLSSMKFPYNNIFFIIGWFGAILWCGYLDQNPKEERK
jgi:hypothetical protein